MPYVLPATLEFLNARMDAARADRQPCIVVPRFAGTAGHPVGFSRDFFAELIALTGDRGARAVIDAHSSLVQRIDVEDPGVVTDIDQPPI
jgi:molybdenum cofactor cytidylyltransferase